MSSQKFSIELEPDAKLRRVVCAATILAGVAGVLIVLALPFGAAVRAGLVLAWLGHVAIDLTRLIRGQRGCRGIRLEPGGKVRVVTPDDCCVAATISPGSVGTSRLAWLCLGAENGRRYRELLSGNCRQNNDWRRFQVIWRHLGAGP